MGQLDDGRFDQRRDIFLQFGQPCANLWIL
jgi:hypothetical protein